MSNVQPTRFKTITEFFRFRGMPAPEHPLVSIMDMSLVRHLPGDPPAVVKDFYSIALKRNFNIRMKYGQQDVDFDNGVMFFMAPDQVLRFGTDVDTGVQQSGWMLLIHPDFLWNTPLARRIKQYEYFNYHVTEALFVSEREEATLNSIIENIRHEYRANIDQFSQDLIIAQIELLLKYSERFYHRQFLTRKNVNHKILDRLEEIINDYFNSEDLMQTGLPTVQHIAGKLNISPNYLSNMLKALTGQTTQQHIHNKLIEKAKERLSVTDLSVSEIAYELGFEHPQSFSKLFKTKTSYSPLEFRASFN
ncbi:helix-turn-helix domain-containing protein [Dyadobacter sandarakinus]|uniref:Helix-turn-helix transcriptional regulator n=1 Tax=Dyadobacter sandarakinus TaxID=2747268 RepID=A0ABX7I1U5_9BACT|nr:response regulator transcription factor [Dyadobacter sandarakinus]QRQ99667.1 helix-turn-helix transcriptional regulator [Dyadobacter sandarakinus]